ncbi:allantoate amidohydrolase [Paenibacillus psychroresistens]|uniref:Allantoate amidohydrolase n=1 Tax=Paenibacillus psychroresistens TaxID=1778678 RepID=A0A6B8RWB6_9BACL|nr:allantoate amidohydrolase [Paenibacillus psychroresistens]
MNNQLILEAETYINWLGKFGGQPNGGVTRLLYTTEWRQAQQALAEKMSECGLQVYDDRVGNLFGRLEGTIPHARTILTGSHIDTVKNGGKYDGAYGIIAGIIALDFLNKTYGSPKRPLEVVALCEEEGSRFPLTFWGSGNITGHHHIRKVDGIKDANDIRFEDAMLQAGFGQVAQKDCIRLDLAAFIELHIEQGVVLERQGVKLGVVESIVGQKRYTFIVDGEAGHAGTTPMHMRRDALTGVAEMIKQLEKSALRYHDQLVATVGFIEAIPNASNVIPGRVIFTVDTRHTNEKLLNQFAIGMISRFHEIAAARQLNLSVQMWMDETPTQLDVSLTARLENICQSQGVSYQRMISGAGHDSQIFQALCPTVMLFVPSRDGISHSPLEYTSPEDLAVGILVLIELLYQLGYEENTDENL